VKANSDSRGNANNRSRAGSVSAMVRTSVGGLAAALTVVAAAAIILDATTSFGRLWLPEIGTSALTLLATIVVVDRVLAQREKQLARPRIEQVLGRVQGNFHTLADFALFDYERLHRDTYE
jgi:hypothetical protein